MYRERTKKKCSLEAYAYIPRVKIEWEGTTDRLTDREWTNVPKDRERPKKNREEKKSIAKAMVYVAEYIEQNQV